MLVLSVPCVPVLDNLYRILLLSSEYFLAIHLQNGNKQSLTYAYIHQILLDLVLIFKRSPLSSSPFPTVHEMPDCHQNPFSSSTAEKKYKYKFKYNCKYKYKYKTQEFRAFSLRTSQLPPVPTVHEMPDRHQNPFSISCLQSTFKLHCSHCSRQI